MKSNTNQKETSGKPKNRGLSSIGLVLLGALLGAGGALALSSVDVGMPISAAVKVLSANALNAPDLATMRDGALQGLAAGYKISAKDRYAYYLTPAQAKQEDAEAAGTDEPDPVLAGMLGGGVAYLRVSDFFRDDINDRTASAAAWLRDQKAEAVVIDLRGNVGGFRDAGEALADRFLSKGRIDLTVSRKGSVPYMAKDEPNDLKIPVAILVDGSSASASEIAAASLRDLGGAVLVGTQTRGKARVQTDLDYPWGGRLTYTKARWLTPKDIDIQDIGLTPDIVITSPEGTPGTPEQQIKSCGRPAPTKLVASACPSTDGDPALKAALEALASGKGGPIRQ